MAISKAKTEAKKAVAELLTRERNRLAGGVNHARLEIKRLVFEQAVRKRELAVLDDLIFKIKRELGL